MIKQFRVLIPTKELFSIENCCNHMKQFDIELDFTLPVDNESHLCLSKIIVFSPTDKQQFFDCRPCLDLWGEDITNNEKYKYQYTFLIISDTKEEWLFADALTIYLLECCDGIVVDRNSFTSNNSSMYRKNVEDTVEYMRDCIEESRKFEKEHADFLAALADDSDDSDSFDTFEYLKKGVTYISCTTKFSKYNKDIAVSSIIALVIITLVLVAYATIIPDFYVLAVLVGLILVLLHNRLGSLKFSFEHDMEDAKVIFDKKNMTIKLEEQDLWLEYSEVKEVIILPYKSDSYGGISTYIFVTEGKKYRLKVYVDGYSHICGFDRHIKSKFLGRVNEKDKSKSKVE